MVDRPAGGAYPSWIAEPDWQGCTPDVASPRDHPRQSALDGFAPLADHYGDYKCPIISWSTLANGRMACGCPTWNRDSCARSAAIAAPMSGRCLRRCGNGDNPRSPRRRRSILPMRMRIRRADFAGAAAARAGLGRLDFLAESHRPHYVLRTGAVAFRTFDLVRHDHLRSPADIGCYDRLICCAAPATHQLEARRKDSSEGWD